ncbi:MAG: adenylate kinase [Planctomycetota bacterium]|nr:adenylate kinase [Planctomycetota bacterium]
MRIICLGPPGIGKGTQAKQMQQRLGVPHIDTGEIFREHAVKGTPLGLKGKSYTDRGDLVPDQLVTEVVMERLRAVDCVRGFLLDGFPRTIPQCEALDTFLFGIGLSIDIVVEYTAPIELIIQRLSGRRVCRQCGRNFHTVFKPSVAGQNCDCCGGTLFQRQDDMPEAIKQRLVVFEKQTLGVASFYGKRGALVTLSGAGTVEEVFARTTDALNKIGRDKVQVS